MLTIGSLACSNSTTHYWKQRSLCDSSYLAMAIEVILEDLSQQANSYKIYTPRKQPHF